MHNLYDNGNGTLTLSIATPGYSKEDLTLSCNGGVLSVRTNCEILKGFKLIGGDLGSVDYEFSINGYEVADTSYSNGLLDVLLVKKQHGVIRIK